MKLGFKKVHPDAKIPTYAHPGDAGMDVYAVEDTLLPVGKPTLVKTGLVAEIPTGYELQVRPRSGLALNGVTVFNSPGTVDSSFKGPIGVILLAVVGTQISRNFVTGEVTYEFAIRKGDRIAQLVLAPVTRCEPVEIAEVSDTERGTGGFGSTGR